MSPGIKADHIYAVFHLFASEVPRFRIPGSRFRFRGFPPAIEVVTDRYKVPGSGSITQRGTLTGANYAVAVAEKLTCFHIHSVSDSAISISAHSKFVIITASDRMGMHTAQCAATHSTIGHCVSHWSKNSCSARFPIHTLRSRDDVSWQQPRVAASARVARGGRCLTLTSRLPHAANVSA